MSLILEALRKSEAERRLGSAPDVLTPMPVLHAPPLRRHRSGAIAGVALSILALAFAGWWMSGHSGSPPHAMTQAVPAASQLVTAIPASSTSSPTPVVPATSSPAIAAAPAARASAAIAAATTPSGVATSPAPRAPVVPRPKARDASAAVLASAARDVASRPTFAALPPAPGVAPVAAPPTPPVDEPALLPVPDLPASERSALPALKVTMHVYADDPAQRFMIIDGQRVSEGGRLGEGVVLVRIRRDGAEIDANGRRLLLPNP
ncbi:MAG TPA: general secretion pathway protein GspB [Xanthomonadaceae bacterium]|jgi:general secretion pathway protein B|nr:general secretion pathway protein GspB [Xanthomonadaceae bacterium]